MRKTFLPLALTLGLVLAGCSGSGGPEAADNLFATCANPKNDLLRVEGSTVFLEILGEDARALAQGSDVTADNVLDADMTGLAIAIAVVSSMECLVEATGYPGLAADIRSGETWGGWTYSETTGAGAEVTMAFEATGDAVVTRNPVVVANQEFYDRLDCENDFGERVVPIDNEVNSGRVHICTLGEQHTMLYEFDDVTERDGYIATNFVGKLDPEFTYLLGTGAWILQTKDSAAAQLGRDAGGTEMR